MYNVWVLAGIWSFMIKQSGCLLETENYMQQIWQIFGPKIGTPSLKNCLQSQTHFWYSKITEFEQNGYLQSGCIQEMVAYKKWSLWTGGHFVCTCVNMGCWSATEAFSVNCLCSVPALAGCFLELNDVYWMLRSTNMFFKVSRYFYDESKFIVASLSPLRGQSFLS